MHRQDGGILPIDSSCEGFYKQVCTIPYIVQHLREAKKQVQSQRVEATILKIDKESSQRRNGAFTLVRIIADVLRSNVINSENS